ncbi:MAG TPA: CDGSH iron-sulfur domain-containing protein, partial [Blastocatellia bacterium]|nr:CDGSH iron-sulfur domain-containing protein [Blastocatellia bacterium]
MSDENDQTIIPINNGPLRIIGSNITIKDAAGNTFGLAGRTVISLCRCGHSEN